MEVINSALLERVQHGFFGRRGGVSTGGVAGLNAGLGAGDDPAAVETNRQLVVSSVMPGSALVTPYQVHSPDVAVVTKQWSLDERPRVDAVVTNKSRLLLGIVTADCAPVLLADAEARVVGAAHAGWKGAHGGVVENTIDAMEALGADRRRISAAIGPCIAQESYEIDDGFRTQFSNEDDRFFVSGKPGHWQFDLEGYVASRLAVAGLTTIDPLGLDTYSDPERFYSYRRATHRAEPTYGRQIAVIGLSA